MSGILYLCATPIGNLDDITFRVIDMLKNCDLIAAEDTRHTLKLLNHFGIETPLISYHEHNKLSKGPVIIDKLKAGLNIALVTDAGMPAISDPGEDLVKLCYENGIRVSCAPGASAALTALVISGMPARRYIFEGFLPSDKKEKHGVLESLKRESRTVVFYEAPHRLSDTLFELYEALGERNAACVREITKKYEEVKKGGLGALSQFYKDNPPKGEFVIIIEGIGKKELEAEKIREWEKITIEEHMGLYLDGGANEKEAMKMVARDRGVSKREIYAYLKG